MTEGKSADHAVGYGKAPASTTVESVSPWDVRARMRIVSPGWSDTGPELAGLPRAGERLAHSRRVRLSSRGVDREQIGDAAPARRGRGRQQRRRERLPHRRGISETLQRMIDQGQIAVVKIEPSPFVGDAGGGAGSHRLDRSHR